MSERLDAAAAALREKIGGSGFRGSVRFDMADDGVIRIEDEAVTTAEGDAADADADCTITASLATFREMFEGDLDPTSAFMTGKMKIEGDMGMAMRLAQAL